MKSIFTILSVVLFLTGSAQVSIGSKSYINSYNVIKKDTCITFRPTGYADYTVKPTADGIYTFAIRVLNNASKGVFLYMWSPASGVWTNAYVAMKNTYQNIPIKVSMTTGTAYVRLYSADSTTVDNLTYKMDADRLTTLEEKVRAMQTYMDSLPNIYVVPGYGTEKNPIKP
jgi:hypothetical protein